MKKLLLLLSLTLYVLGPLRAQTYFDYATMNQGTPVIVTVSGDTTIPLPCIIAGLVGNDMVHIDMRTEEERNIIKGRDFSVTPHRPEVYGLDPSSTVQLRIVGSPNTNRNNKSFKLVFKIRETGEQFVYQISIQYAPVATPGTTGAVNLGLLPQERQYYTKALNNIRNKLVADINLPGHLVSDYTFRTMVRNDFSQIITGDKNKTTIGRYAALDINSAQKRFTLTPVVYAPGNDPLKSPFNFIHSLDISGTLSNNNIFNLKDRKSLTIGYSLTWVKATYGFNLGGSLLAYRASYINLCNQIYQQFIAKWDKYNTSEETKIELDAYARDTSVALKKAYLDKMKEFELKISAPYWGAKKMYWVKATFNLLSWDNFNYLDPKDSLLSFNPQKKSVYNPSLFVSGNIYYVWPKAAMSFYGSIYLKFAMKHTLSEIASPRQWNRVRNLNDSISYAVDKGEVYDLDVSKFNKLGMFDWGLQVIYLKSFYDVLDIGVDLKFDRANFITPGTKNSLSYIDNYSIGIIFPLTDKEGRSTVNIEPFFQYQQYIDLEKASNEIWGVKFALPFNNLY